MARSFHNKNTVFEVYFMLNSIIRKHVLKNIADYGKANPGSIIGKVIGEYPECKTDVKGTMGKISAEIARASKLSKEELEQEMSEFEYIVKEEKEKTITLPNAEAGKVVTRFPPEPSGYPHIGHAKAAWLDYEAAANYDGKMLLRFDDTNPEKESAEYVDAIKEGLAWLGIKWAGESYTSDNMDKIYEAAEKLISGGNAYVSTSAKEQLSDSRTNSKPLPERSLAPEEHLSRWKKMLSGEYKQGEALLLFKGDLESKNTVMRDPALARIIEKEHYRQGKKYTVWPSYDLSVVVMDHLEGLTHPMRSKEYELRDELYARLFELLGWKSPTMVPFSRLAIKNAPISKRLITPLVTDGKVMGWDDPRLPTVSGLKRRGLLAEAIKQFVLYFGLSRTESEPDWEVLLAFNRKLLDKEAPHYFFVPDPVKLEISGFEDNEIELSIHPKKDLGKRKIKASSAVYIPRSDAEKLEAGEIFRLKDLCNVKLVSKGETYSCELSEDGMVPKKLQWVSEDHLECEVLIPKDLLKDGEFNPESLESVKGLCEKSVKNLAPDSIIQFERFGFCRLDKTEPLIFIFSC